MDTISQLRNLIPFEVFDYQVIMVALSRYRKPRDIVSRLVRECKIVRIKKGLYCFAENYRKSPISRGYLSNLIYGPSYVSLDYALSYYGLIPEAVYSITSVTMRRSCRFNNLFGLFIYQKTPESKYSCGITLTTEGIDTSYLIASPEKALVDKIWFDKRFSGRNKSEFRNYIYTDLRIEVEDLIKLDLSELYKISNSYNSLIVSNLFEFVVEEKRKYA